MFEKEGVAMETIFFVFSNVVFFAIGSLLILDGSFDPQWRGYPLSRVFACTAGIVCYLFVYNNMGY